MKANNAKIIPSESKETKHLIIEVDGGYHYTEEQQNEDAIRSQYLTQIGFRILRFTNQEVTMKTDSVIEKIKQAL